MPSTAYVSHYDCSRHDTGWRHPDHQGRLAAVSQAVYRDMLALFDVLLQVEGEPATEADLGLVHTERYIARVRDLTADAGRHGTVLPLSGDTVVSGASWEAALAAVGCALTGVDAVLAGDVTNAFCATRPPGHGAHADSAGGFSIFNNVAIAARHLRDRRGLDRVLVVEWGAEPGWGTAEVTADDPGIRFISVHQQQDASIVRWPDGSWPAPVPPGTAGPVFLDALRTALDDALDDFPPQFILLSLGCDALASDPLGALELQPSDYHSLTLELRARADALCAGRIVSVLEGGYDAAATGQAVVQHVRALAGLESKG